LQFTTQQALPTLPESPGPEHARTPINTTALSASRGMKIWKQSGTNWKTVIEGVQNRILAVGDFFALSMIKFERGG